MKTKAFLPSTRSRGLDPRSRGRRGLLGVLAIALLWSSLAVPALADAPPLPCRFYGELPESQPGTTVSARVAGVEYASSVSFVDAGRAVYVIDVPGDDPSTPEIEGATDGAAVVFRLDGVDTTQGSAWSPGQAVAADLQPVPQPGGPVAADLVLESLEDVPLALVLEASDPDGQPLTFAVTTPPSHGTLEGTAPMLTYVPDADWNGTDGFTFEASDGTDSDLGTVTITVGPVPDPPVLAAIPNSQVEAGSMASLPVLATDADGHVITLSAEGLPTFAQLVETGNGQATVELSPGFGDVGLYGASRIVASDGSLSDEVVFSIEVVGATGPPVAVDQAVVTPEDTAVPVTLEASDPDGETMTFEIVTAPAQGALSGAAPALVYTPEADFFGADSFTFTATASDGTSNVATVSLTVEPVADAPRLDPLDDRTMAEGSTVVVPVVAIEVDGDPITWSIVGLPSFASFEDLGGGLGEITLAPGFADAGSYPGIEVGAFDGTFDAVETFDLTVDDFESPPVAAFRAADALDVAALAGGATIESASGHQGGAIPERAIDGRDNTNWRADPTGPQWIRVRLRDDLDPVIDRVVVRGRGTNSGVRNFEIRVSTTGAQEADFTTVFAGELPQDNLDHEFGFSPVEVRFVELRALDNWGNGSAMDIFNFEVHTRSRQGGVVSLVGGGAVVADASSVSQPAANAIDLSDGTRWLSVNGQGMPQWITVDLIGDSWIIDRVRIVGPSNDSSPADIELRVSTTGLDPLDFTTVYQGTVPEGGEPHWALFDPVEARYVQLFVDSTHGLSFVAVGSFDVYSPEVGGPEVPFDDGSVDPDGSVVSWSWDFGDGNSSVERHPVHVYGAPGLYTVGLTVTDDQGRSTLVEHPYTALATPVASFSWTPQPTVFEGDAVRFSDLSTSENAAIESWLWTFHEGSWRTSDDPVWSYGDDGSYPVALEVTDGRGLTASTTIPVPVENAPPSINLIPGPSTVWGETWQLGQASVTDPGGDDYVDMLCSWDFGDGQTTQIAACFGTDARIEHTYDLPGIYTATLTADDGDGGVVQASLDHSVLQRPSRITLLTEDVLLATDELLVVARLVDDFVGGDPPNHLPLAGRTITFRRGVEAVDAVTDANGEASVTLTLDPAAEAVVVEFAGDALYLGDSGRQLPPGSVLAGIGEGIVHVYTPDGELIETLDTGSGSLEQTGMCLDPMGILYTTNFLTLQQPLSQSYGSTSRLDRWGNRLDALWTGPYDPNPESCVIDPAGNVLVALVDGGANEDLLYHYAPDGSLIGSWRPEEEHRGVDWIDLAADGCTLFYTSEGTRVLRFDVCTGQQLPDFAGGLESPTFALRIRPNGEVLVASSDQIYRLDAQGQVIQTYLGPSGDFFALNLDPDGASFWTAYYGLGTIFRVDIETGQVLTSFTAGPLPFALSGLAIVGEPTAANNHPPVADAGADGLATVGGTVGLDGTASSDPDVGDVLSFAWLQTSGPAVVLDDSASPTPSFDPTEEGTYGFELTVSDGARTDVDTVQVVVEPAPAGCALAPFTIDWAVLGGVAIGGWPVEVPRGITSGHFGWLSWSGAEDVATLATSLTPPGDSHTWEHPAVPEDTVISPGDWIFALDDQPDDVQLQAALDALIGQDIVVPIWDYHYQGPDYQKFRVGAFVQLRLTAYQLDGEDRLSIQYFGEAQCP